MNTLVGAGTSAGLRYLISTMSVGMSGPQMLVFHALDMTISTFASHFFASKSDQINPFFAGRAFGLITAATITSILLGALSLPQLIVASAIAQVAGICLNITLSKESSAVIV